MARQVAILAMLFRTFGGALVAHGSPVKQAWRPVYCSGLAPVPASTRSPGGVSPPLPDQWRWPEVSADIRYRGDTRAGEDDIPDPVQPGSGGRGHGDADI